MKDKPYAKSHKRVSSLPPNKKKELDDHIIRDTSLKTLVVLIKEQWGLWQDISAAGALKCLQRYRKDRIRTLDIARNVGTEEELETAIVEISKARDIVQDFNWVIAKFIERINMGLVREKATKFPLAPVRKELESLGRVLESFAKFQVAVGLVNDAGGKVENNPESVFDTTSEALQLVETIKEIVAISKADPVVEAEFVSSDKT